MTVESAFNRLLDAARRCGDKAAAAEQAATKRAVGLTKPMAKSRAAGGAITIARKSHTPMSIGDGAGARTTVPVGDSPALMKDREDMAKNQHRQHSASTAASMSPRTGLANGKGPVAIPSARSPRLSTLAPAAAATVAAATPTAGPQARGAAGKNPPRAVGNSPGEQTKKTASSAATIEASDAEEHGLGLSLGRTLWALIEGERKVAAAAAAAAEASSTGTVTEDIMTTADGERDGGGSTGGSGKRVDGLNALGEEGMKILRWHVANIEYSTGVSTLLCLLRTGLFSSFSSAINLLVVITVSWSKV